MVFIYIIGAQFTGKTSLVEGLMKALRVQYANTAVHLVGPAYETLIKHGYYKGDDFRRGDQASLDFHRDTLFQQQVAERMTESEVKAAQDVSNALDKKTGSIIVCDGSGLDPMVYAQQFCGKAPALEYLEGKCWHNTISRMRKGVVVVCTPVVEWLFDNGSRSMPQDDQEWFATHDHFLRLLKENEIAYNILPSYVKEHNDRVVLVMRWLSEAMIQAMVQADEEEAKKQQTKEEIRQEIKKEVKDQLVYDIYAEYAGDVMAEVREEIMDGIKDDVVKEIKEEIEKDFKGEIKLEIKQELRKELKQEMTEIYGGRLRT